VRGYERRLTNPSPGVLAQTRVLRHYLHKNLYNHAALAPERERGIRIVEDLFSFYMKHPERLPKTYADLAQQQPRHRVVCDYIAGMTDSFIQKVHQELLSGAPSGSLT
jgi:dGTPase